MWCKVYTIYTHSKQNVHYYHNQTTYRPIITTPHIKRHICAPSNTFYRANVATFHTFLPFTLLLSITNHPYPHITANTMHKNARYTTLHTWPYYSPYQLLPMYILTTNKTKHTTKTHDQNTTSLLYQTNQTKLLAIMVIQPASP